MNAGNIQAARVRIHGRVQQVGFRNWTVAQAATLGLSGWVRNCGDGTVEAVFVGPLSAIDTMVARCADGPPRASVTGVERLSVSDFPQPGSGFRALPDA